MIGPNYILNLFAFKLNELWLFQALVNIQKRTKSDHHSFIHFQMKIDINFVLLCPFGLASSFSFSIVFLIHSLKKTFTVKHRGRRNKQKDWLEIKLKFSLFPALFFRPHLNIGHEDIILFTILFRKLACLFCLSLQWDPNNHPKNEALTIRDLVVKSKAVEIIMNFFF